jgi:hypothetical protein
MAKKIIITLFGTAILSALWTYYKTDDPVAAVEILVGRAKTIWEDVCEVAEHYLEKN